MLTLKRKSQNGLSLIWKIKSPQSGAPFAAHISDDGQHVVLQDEAPGHGYGFVLAFIGPAGRVLSSYRLADVLSATEISEVLHTVSNIWWSSGAMLYLRYPQRQFVFITEKCTIHLFDLATGKPTEVTPVMNQQIRNERMPVARRELRSSKSDDRIRAAGQIAQLNDRASIPDLIRLMDDPTTERCAVSQNPDAKDGLYRMYPVRWSAGIALVRLMGPEAVQHISKRIHDYDKYELTRWKWLIEHAKAGGLAGIRY